jgi:hypothetical protein
MTNEQKAKIAQKLTEWDGEKLLQAFLYYSQRFSPFDFNDETEDNIKYYLIKAEMLRRMA